MGGVYKKTTAIVAALEDYTLFPAGTYSAEALRIILIRHDVISKSEGDLHFSVTYIPRAKNWSCSTNTRPLVYKHAAQPVKVATQETRPFDEEEHDDGFSSGDADGLRRIEAKLDKILSVMGVTA